MDIHATQIILEVNQGYVGALLEIVSCPEISMDHHENFTVWSKEMQYAETTGGSWEHDPPPPYPKSQSPPILIPALDGKSIVFLFLLGLYVSVCVCVCLYVCITSPRLHLKSYILLLLDLKSPSGHLKMDFFFFWKNHFFEKK